MGSSALKSMVCGCCVAGTGATSPTSPVPVNPFSRTGTLACTASHRKWSAVVRPVFPTAPLAPRSPVAAVSYARL
jgi:hypothetical protein